MKAVLYARVSSERQAEKDLSISAQLKAMRKYAASRNYEIVREFVDEAESARTANRPAFQEMISLARSKEKPFDAVLVWKLSRFARNREDSIVYKSLLKKKSIQVISINEQIDDSPAGGLLEGIIEVIDEFYSANLAQDTKRGMRESASRGFFTGGHPPIGYKAKPIKVGNASKKTLEIDEDFATIIRRIYDMAISGTGAKEIAKALNNEGILTNRGKKWTKNLVLYVLRNELYAGTLVWGKSDPTCEPLRIENNFPAMVSKDTYNRVQSLIEARSPLKCRPRTLTSPYLLSGIIVCGKCGYAMQGGSAKSGKFHYYACNNSIRKGKQACDIKMINRDRLEALVIEKLKEKVLTEDNLFNLLNLTNQAIERLYKTDQSHVALLNKEIEKHQRKLDNLYRVLETGKLDIDDIAPRIKELKSEIDGLKAQQNVLLQSQRKPIPILNKRQLQSYVANMRQILTEGTIFEQKGFINSFVKKVTAFENKIIIEYTYPLSTATNSGYMEEVLCSELKSSPCATLFITVLHSDVNPKALIIQRVIKEHAVPAIRKRRQDIFP